MLKLSFKAFPIFCPPSSVIEQLNNSISYNFGWEEMSEAMLAAPWSPIGEFQI